MSEDQVKVRAELDAIAKRWPLYDGCKANTKSDCERCVINGLLQCVFEACGIEGWKPYVEPARAES